MDDAFLQELDSHLSFVGTDEMWEREIAGRKIFFSPIPFAGEAKVNETLNNPDLKINVFAESKRITLAWAIVGVDDFDLRKYRDGREVFPMFDPRVRKEVKVSLATYMYAKLQTWGSEFVNAAFDVFVDLMQTYRKKALENVKLENLKDPMAELAELETRAAELRQQLGLKPMVEAEEQRAGGTVDYGADLEPDVPDEEPRRPAAPKARPEPQPPAEVAFNPFGRAEEPVPDAAPTPELPIPVAPQVARHASARDRAAELADLDSDLPVGKTPERPHTPLPSVRDEVVEGPTGVSATRAPEPVAVDRVVRQSVNPRFKPRGV